MVYITEFPYLDYSFDVPISQIGNLGLYNSVFGFAIFTLLTASLPALVCLCSRHDFQYMLFDSDLSIHVCLSMYATWHSPHHSLGSSDSLTCMFRSWSLDRGALPDDQSCAVVASWISSWPSRALSFQAPYSSLEFSFYNLWASFVLFIFIYLFVFSHLRLSEM